ncbi:MAG: hypothetical protein K6E85_15680 [Lachnospiraceae bacterium]|nr:hypothetical protein [Lachnospiraceae bacterium]
MKFCPYCGKQLQDGEVCSCQSTNTNSAGSDYEELKNDIGTTAENEHDGYYNDAESKDASYTAENAGSTENSYTAEPEYTSEGIGSAGNDGSANNAGGIMTKITAFLKSKAALGLLGAVGALIVVCIILCAVLNSDPKKKVVNAVEKTFKDSGYLIKDISKFKVDPNKLTYTVSAKYNDMGMSASMIINGNEKAITGKITDDDDTVIEASATIDKKDLKVCFPGTDYKKLLVYRYTADDKDGLEKYIGEKNLEAIDTALKALYDTSFNNSGSTKKLTKTLKKWAKDLETSKLDSKSFKINGEKRDCKGYEIVFTEDNLIDLVEHVVEWAKEEYGESLEDSIGKDGFDDILKDAKKSFNGMGKITLKCYLYKGMLAAVVLEDKSDNKFTAEFNGGDYRMQEINVYSGKKSDDQQIMKISGKLRDTKETVTIEIPNTYSLEYSYDKSSGKFSVSLQQYSYWSDKFEEKGSLKGKLDISGSKFAFQITNIDVNGSSIEFDDLSMEILSKASMPKMKGTEFRIDEADKSDIEDEIKDLTGELTDAIYDSDLKDMINSLKYNGLDF